MSAEVAVRVQNVSKTYRIYDKPEHRLVQMATLGRVRRFKEFSALKDVSLEVRRGETVGIVGRNGCGKSTLLQIICGTLQPSGGHVEVNGRVAALLELGAGFNGEFTGRENVYMNGAILGFSREEMDARFDQIAAFAGIGDFIERPVKTYSSGMFVRLAFAVATTVEPDILIVDEALAVGDEAFQRKCFARIEGIKERGGTILFVSHGAQSVIQLCDRAVLLDGGEKLLEGNPKRVVSQYQRLLSVTDSEVAAGIRTEIRFLQDRSDIYLDLDESLSQIGEESKETDTTTFDLDIDESLDEIDQALEIFDPNLVSESRVEYQSLGARIENLRIVNSGEQPVNVLRRGQRYTFEYEVSYDEDAKDITFGMLIRAVNGADIAGIGTNLISQRRFQAKSGQKTLVRMHFDCRLAPGVYFLTCGTGAERNGERLLLHRIVDGIPFRVVDSGRQAFSGYVDLRIRPEIVADPT